MAILHNLSGMFGAPFHNGDTLSLDYPPDTTQDTFTDSDGHVWIVNQKDYQSDDSEFTLSFDASLVVLTNATGKTFGTGSTWSLQLKEFEETTGKLLGRASGEHGDQVQEVTPGNGLSLTGRTLNSNLNQSSSIAEVLGVRDTAVETVPVTNFQNTGEGSYGATQNFGSTFWNPVKELWYSTINTGFSAFLIYSEDGLNWSTPVLIGQDPVGYLVVAAGCDSDGFVWVIACRGGVTDDFSTIKKTNTNGEFWEDTDSTFTVGGLTITEIIGPIQQIGDGRMVAVYASDPNTETGLFFFNPANPATQTILNLDPFGLTYSTELTLCYDAENEVLVGLARTESTSIPVKMLTLSAPWTTPVITSLDEDDVPPITVFGNQISVACLGDLYVASITSRTPGLEYLLVADRNGPQGALADPADAWTLYLVGQSVRATSSNFHVLNGGGGLASNGTDTLIHMTGVAFGADRSRDAELQCTRYQLSPDVENPVVRTSDAVRLRPNSLPKRPLADNQNVTVSGATAMTLSANCVYPCRGRAIISLPPDAEEGDKIWLEKSEDDLYVVKNPSQTGQEYRDALWARSGATITVTFALHNRTNGESIKIMASSDDDAIPVNEVETVGGATDDTFTFTGVAAGGTSGTLTYRLYATETIHWTDGVTYTAGTPSDLNGRRRTYVFTCLGVMEWLVESYQAGIEHLASAEAITTEHDYAGNIVARLDLMSGRDFMFKQDDFSGGGELDWVATESNGGSFNLDQPLNDHPGICKCITDVNNNDIAQITDFNRWFVRGLNPWFAEFIFSLPTVTNVYAFLGLEFAGGTYTGGGVASVESVSGVIGLKFDTAAASDPTQFKSITKATTATETVLGVVAAGIWYRLEISETTIGTINFRLVKFSGGEVVATSSHTTDLPTNALYRACRVHNQTNASRELHVDYSGIAQWGFTER